MYTVAHHHAICYATFGIEDLGEPFAILQGALFGMDTGDEMLKVPQNPQEYASVNRILTELAPALGKAYGTDLLQGAIGEKGETSELTFGSVAFEVAFASKYIRRKNGACMILQNKEDDFYAVLFGCALDIKSLDPLKPYIDFLSVETGRLTDGEFHVSRRLNGDEITIMSFEEPTLLRIKLYSYK